jgi:hypothetical protein
VFLKTAYKVNMMMDFQQSQLSPLVAFIGGVVSQEIVKAITQKFVPIKQLATFSFSEFIDTPDKLVSFGDYTKAFDAAVAKNDECLKNSKNLVEAFRINLFGSKLYQ